MCKKKLRIQIKNSKIKKQVMSFSFLRNSSSDKITLVKIIRYFDKIKIYIYFNIQSFNLQSRLQIDQFSLHQLFNIALKQNSPNLQLIPIYQRTIIYPNKIMENPQTSRSAIISPKEIFAYDNHKNIPWNINQYQVPTLPNDYKDIIRKRQYATQKKGVKNNDFYVTKRGFYMDYSLKIGATVPGSNLYQKQQPWPHQKHDLDQEGLKLHRSMMKYSYLQRIQMQEKNRSKPGVGAYNLQKSLDQIKVQNEKRKSQKRYFYEDTQHLADKAPGPGAHNPHDQVEHLRKTRTDHKFWVQKHKKQLSLNTTRDLKKPNPASYSPLHQSYTTFLTTMGKKKTEWVKKNGFGSDARFPYVRKNKKVIIQERPAPCTYQTKIEWKGKQVSPQKKRWADIIYTGSPPKVYH